MNIKNFLLLNDIQQKKLVEYIKCSKSTISRIVNSKALPSLSLALKIEKFTGGKVKPNTFFKEQPKEPK